MKKILSIVLLLSGVIHAAEKKGSTVSQSTPIANLSRQDQTDAEPMILDLEGNSGASFASKEIAKAEVTISSLSFMDIALKGTTLFQAHLKENPALEKAFIQFKHEFTTSLMHLKNAFMSSIDTTQIQKFMMHPDAVASGNAILSALGEFTTTLQHNPDKPFGPDDHKQMNDMLNSIVKHTHVITTKAVEHIKESEKKESVKDQIRPVGLVAPIKKEVAHKAIHPEEHKENNADHEVETKKEIIVKK